MENVDVGELEENLGYKFKNRELLKTALTHSSYANENKMEVIENNERLEFLGDSVIGLILSQHLYRKYPEFTEGKLTKRRALFACESSLAYSARDINLGKYLLLGKGEIITGGRDRDSILADALESIAGAIYMDSDFETAKDIMVKSFYLKFDQAMNDQILFKDYKTNLQEELQKENGTVIKYNVFKETGPDHDKTFHVEVLVNGNRYGMGLGENKKEAEQNAAKNAFRIVNKDED